MHTRSTSDVSARLRLVITRSARRLRQEAGAELSPSLAAALATIENHGPLAPSRLAELERVKRPTATRVLARLEEEGLIDRMAHGSDRRTWLVSATPAGRALLKKMRSRKNAYLEKRLRDLSSDELAALDRAAEILERLLLEERA